MQAGFLQGIGDPAVFFGGHALELFENFCKIAAFGETAFRANIGYGPLRIIQLVRGLLNAVVIYIFHG